MFLLYADESGTPGGADQEHFVLAGFSVFERSAHWLSLELDKIAATFNPQEPHSVELQIVTRFDHFLARQHVHFNNTQRGLILFDKSSKEAPIQALAKAFKLDGHDWGRLRNMAEVPAFIDSEATRLIQLADLIAYALFRYYEKKDGQFFDLIERKFDYFGGVQHGLHTVV
ncbi:DUF3800 domain-containing protein [Salinivibrio kushneri]|uniref:DUF3800 domain-containing protein n=1 Tax=Salinivibrio kushneri TaxID=1908198 RepID=UPI000987880E|nr:DUF3800 domain-containing protein [Salinivibrio kushneri]OOE48626.1 hypothetical protein BZG11_14145 [Salinivibrio kushneri]OOE56705.1 hypothetical protein BZG10_00005 [Salinivibrio kushneri]OOE60607.1 hypothetical protein BZG18_11665 [Salinivibrio kushneri]